MIPERGNNKGESLNKYADIVNRLAENVWGPGGEGELRVSQ